jgi:hypothetical protein
MAALDAKWLRRAYRWYTGGAPWITETRRVARRSDREPAIPPTPGAVMRHLLASFLLLAACGDDAALGEQASSITTPTEIAVPPGQHITLEAHGVGFQIYECSASRTWAFHAPAALLFAPDGAIVATHFGGIDVGLPAGVYWQSTLDASRVHGFHAIASPNPPNIPQLRLEAEDTAGNGIFTPTTFIQRLNTVGGAAPAGSCPREGLRLPVAYEARYVFYAAGLPRPETPAAITVADGQNVAHVFHGVGFQVYQCAADGSWAFHAPIADLFDSDGNLVVRHFGGIDAGLPAGVYWQSVRDGSRVHGGNAVSAPNPGAIALLRLDALDTFGTGILSRVSFIQRLATVGGLAPATPCGTVDAQARVPYEADYYFYIPAEQ